MASLVVLGAIYLKDKDSSQGIKNPIMVQSTQTRRKLKQAEAVMHKDAVRNPAKFAGSAKMQKLPYPAKVSYHCSLVLLLLTFLLFCHFLDFFLICPLVIVYCCCYFGNL